MQNEKDTGNLFSRLRDSGRTLRDILFRFFFLMDEAKVPFEVFLHIVSFLPDTVVYALWCSGRELHSQKDLYNERILPFVRVAQ